MRPPAPPREGGSGSRVLLSVLLQGHFPSLGRHPWALQSQHAPRARAASGFPVGFVLTCNSTSAGSAKAEIKRGPPSAAPAWQRLSKIVQTALQLPACPNNPLALNASFPNLHGRFPQSWRAGTGALRAGGQTKQSAQIHSCANHFKSRGAVYVKSYFLLPSPFTSLLEDSGIWHSCERKTRRWRKQKH